MRKIIDTLSLKFMLLLSAAAFLGVIGAIMMPKAYAADAGERLVMIHDRGVELGVITQATTLRAVLAEANIRLDANDRVEPGLDETLVANNYQVNIYRARPVVIVDGPVKQLVMSAYQTPKQIAQHAGIKLRDEDSADVSVTSDFVSDGASLRMDVDRAEPVRLTLYGETQTVYTQATNVREFLREKSIELGPQDDMSLGTDAKLKPGIKLSIWRNGKQTVTREEKIAYPVEQIKDANREAGYRQVKTPGADGKKMVTYEIVMRDGKEVSRKTIQSVTTKQPKKQVEVIGTKLPPVAGPAEILNRINAASTRLGIDANRVATIAKCESGFNPRADSGYYKGLFQHDPGYWPARAERYGFAGASIFDVDAQIGVSTAMMAGGGWSHWGCDPGV